MEHTSDDLNKIGSVERPPCTGLTPDALPEVLEPAVAENSQTGVSTRNVPSGTGITLSKEAVPDSAKPKDGEESKTSARLKTIRRRPRREAHWYALRATYGREKKAYEYLVEKHVEAYYPTIETVKMIDGKRKTIVESRLPNIFFAYGKEELKSFVYDNVNLPYLRFYYRKTHVGNRIVNVPLVVPDNQIESLKIICAADVDDVVIASGELNKFKEGQSVRKTEGEFKGVTGKVARYKNHQRVGIVIEGLLTICTAYISSAFIKIIED